MCADITHFKLLRVVVREDFSMARCELLLRDIEAALKALDAIDEASVKSHRYGSFAADMRPYTHFVSRSEHVLEHGHSALHNNSAKFIAKEGNDAEDKHKEEVKTAPGVC